jgi:hypothetical protein
MDETPFGEIEASYLEGTNAPSRITCKSRVSAGRQPQGAKGCLCQTSNSTDMNYAKLQAMVDMFHAFGPDAMHNSEDFATLSCDEQMILEQEIELS